MDKRAVDIEEIRCNIYDSLVQIRYPGITMAQPKNVQFTILSGKNRISLLSWLLSEKSSDVATALRNLQDTALEDKLFQYYYEIGICAKKDTLLGNCSLNDELEFLNLLLHFIRTMYSESLIITQDTQESINNILQGYLSEDANVPLSSFNVQPKLKYEDALLYFEDIKNIIKQSKTDAVCKDDTNQKSLKESFTENRAVNEDDVNESFDIEMKKFIEMFSTSVLWTKSNSNATSASHDCTDNMDACIKDMYSNFCTLKQTLQAKHEISKIAIPKELKSTDTPLNTVVEDAVGCLEKVINIDISDHPTVDNI